MEERRQTMRLIDADALKEGINELKRSPWYNNDINPSWQQGIKDAVHIVETLCIDEEPTVDAVPVIRCKDCAEFNRWDDESGECCDGLADGAMVRADGYCYAAERKDKDETD